MKREEAGRRAIRHIERERQRLARELHTGIGQLLASIRVQVEILEVQCPGLPPAVRDGLDRISALAYEALDQVRFISRRMHPPEWQRLTLTEALRQLWNLAGMSGRFQGEVRIPAMGRDPGVEIKSLMFRAAQEGIANAMRHSRATRVDLILERRPDVLSLQMRDDGVGFDAVQLFAAPASVQSGIGLSSLRDEAAELGGKLLVTSGPSGTTLEVSVPWQSDGPEPAG